MLTEWAKNFRDLILHPMRFFEVQSTHGVLAPGVKGAVASALAFALVCHWIGAAGSFLWSTVIQEFFHRFMQQSFPSMQGQTQTTGLFGFLLGSTFVMLDPIKTAIFLIFSSFFVYLSAQLLLPKEEPTVSTNLNFETVLKIMCFAEAPYLFCIVPFFGDAFAWIYKTCLVAIGISKVYRQSMGRSLLTAAFPWIIFFFFVISIIVVVGLAALIGMVTKS